jgi:dCTP diphosphatase
MKDLEKDIFEYLKERDWHTLRPSDLAKSISIESAELLELFQWTSMTPDEVKADPEKMEKLKNELADIMIYCLDMAVILGIDPEAAIREKLEYIKKKYPAELMREAQKDKAPGTHDAYWQIKKEHRKHENS